jgi:predicted MFS family arabinose efflux permease
LNTRQLKTGYFILAALNTLATTYFLDYLFFFLRDHFGFGNRENLWVSALHGFIYIFSAWQCGKFAQRRGFLISLKLGFVSLMLLMVIGALLHSALAFLGVVAVYSIVLLFTWPALEALVSENETQLGVQNMVGVYNCTWAAAAALAFFTGGKLYDWSHELTVFWLPAILFAVQLIATCWLANHARRAELPGIKSESSAHHPDAAALHQPVSPETFLKMAWLANPFAYVAINTLWAVMPGIAEKLKLSPTRVGLFCSVWLFARLAVFALLWKWNGWHYRFRWLLASFIMLIGSFMLLLLATQLWLVVVAQIFFGFAVGHIYYSALFYSMDVGKETQAEHGGLHEAFIGAGVFAGPAVGALALQFLPQHPNAGAYAVGGLLILGLGGLIGLRLKK